MSHEECAHSRRLQNAKHLGDDHVRVLDLLQDADLHVIDHQRHPLRIACVFERLRNVEAVDDT
jgi:hypothetical protein